jgi:hypothetical protein
VVCQEGLISMELVNVSCNFSDLGCLVSVYVLVLLVLSCFLHPVSGNCDED